MDLSSNNSPSEARSRAGLTGWGLPALGHGTPRPELFHLYNQLEHHAGVAVAVVDDACYERTEAMVAILADDFGISEDRLARAFVMNPHRGQFLSHEKPLSRGANPLKLWFEGQREAGNLVPEHQFEYGGFTFQFDNFLALRCTAIPHIYFSSDPHAYWGIGHAAPMVDGFVLDPSIGQGPLEFHEWRAALQLPGVITLLGSARGLPKLDIQALDDTALKRVAEVGVECNTLPVYQNALPRNEIEMRVAGWNAAEQETFFDTLFKDQLHDGAVLPYRLWSSLFPGPLTFRGEIYGQPNSATKAAINSSLDGTWAERKSAALEILKPFRAFRDLIQSGTIL